MATYEHVKEVVGAIHSNATVNRLRSIASWNLFHTHKTDYAVLLAYIEEMERLQNGLLEYFERY